MKIVIENKIEVTKELKIDDIVRLEHMNTTSVSLYVVARWRGNHNEFEYVLLNLNSDAFVNTNSRTFNGSHKTLDDLTLSVKNNITEYYSSDEYEMLLRKKKKC
ncbi:hypothetical protein [Metaclostridioides mangenotii]|uniref:hypothetical protein n=1 Tax=Metaclostridioides mangenotii TaxID=1540 RepID=UPI000483C7F8|nr:hypothetical protein [Clostridioides mangenotii]